MMDEKRRSDAREKSVKEEVGRRARKGTLS
jgi:hypothetical protein